MSIHFDLLDLLSPCALRYQDAIEKYESAMKTEPNVAYYSNLAKERICYCLVKVRVLVRLRWRSL